MKCRVLPHVLKLPKQENILGSCPAGNRELFVFLTSHFCNHVRPDFSRGQIFQHSFITRKTRKMMQAQKKMHIQRRNIKFGATQTDLMKLRNYLAFSFLFSFFIFCCDENSRTESTAIHTYNDVNILPADICKCLKLSDSQGIIEPGTLVSVD